MRKFKIFVWPLYGNMRKAYHVGRTTLWLSILNNILKFVCHIIARFDHLFRSWRINNGVNALCSNPLSTTPPSTLVALIAFFRPSHRNKRRQTEASFAGEFRASQTLQLCECVWTVWKVFGCHYSSHRKYLHNDKTHANALWPIEIVRCTNRSAFSYLVNNVFCMRWRSSLPTNHILNGEWWNWHFSWFVANWRNQKQSIHPRRMHLHRSKMHIFSPSESKMRRKRKKTK